jgi:predicted DNA-binding ribbon-helix-helix protein
MTTRPLKRSFSLDGHRTSVSLEAPFWDALQEVAREEKVSMAALVQRIDHARGKEPAGASEAAADIGLSGAIRVYLLQHFRARVVP